MALTSTFQLVSEKKLGNVYNTNAAYLRLYARISSNGGDVATNQTKVYLEARLYSESTWYSGNTTTYRITGSGGLDSGTISCPTTSSNMWPKGEATLGSVSGFITHNEDGTRSVHGEVNFYSSPWGWDVTASATNLVLPTIPRYATITTHEISQVTQDSIQVKWGADRSCSAVQYSLNGGSWTTPTIASFPTYTIPNLKSGTSYTIKTRVQSADSGLWTESGTLTATTKEYVVKTKIMDIWKNAVPYVNINGEWKKAIPYVNVNGTWKSCIE